MKKIEDYEVEKLNAVLELVKEEIKRNDLLYSKMLKETYNDDLIFEMSKSYDNKIRNLKKASLNPYFARIDFKADDAKVVEKICIGKTNIFDENSNIAVVDWRAPISSIYYDGKIEKTQYKCPDGIIEGDLLHKRQYTIEHAKLIDYNDIDITTNDQMLQDCLNENSDVRLKNIAIITKDYNESKK